jgi:predicted nucleic-acid-binding protein
MIGLDTNVVVRLLVNDDEDQVKKVRQVLDRRTSAEAPAFIGTVVMVEAFWALDRLYHIPGQQIIEAFRELLSANNVTVERASELRQALDDFERGADFADALIGERNRAMGAATTVTFDRDAAQRLEHFELL